MTSSTPHCGIDIIIATYKRPDSINVLVNSILNQCTGSDMIYIVFQELSEKIEFTSTKVISLYSGPPNLPNARNLGIKAGSNPIVLFIDDDVIPDNNLLTHHRNSFQDPMIGCVAGYVDDPLFDKNAAKVPSIFDPLSGKLVQNFSINKSQYTISAMGANMSFKREALNTVGKFDSGFKRNALWEEIDYTFRLLKSNYLIWFNADAKVVHLRNSTGGCRADNSYKYLFNNYANTAYFCCKYAPFRFTKTWLHYWKYRLEYDTRKKQNNHKKTHIKHDYLAVLSGFSGAIAGILRYVFSGRRIGLPEQLKSCFKVVL